MGRGVTGKNVSPEIWTPFKPNDPICLTKDIQCITKGGLII